MKNFFWTLLVFAFALVSCHEKKQQNNLLTIGVMSSMDFVPIAVAQELGYFGNNNIEVQIQKFYSANDRDAAFQAGATDGTVIDYTGAILQKAGGIDLKLTSACDATFCIMTSPDSKINQITDLQNKKVAVSQNTVIDFCMDMAFQSGKVNTQTIQKQEINRIPIRFEMLMNNKTDATALPDPFMTMAKNNGAQSLICMSDLGYTVTGIMFKTTVLEDKEEAIHSFYKAYNEAVEYITNNDISAIRDILIREIGFPEPLVDAVELPPYTTARQPADSDISATIVWLQEKGLIPNDFLPEELIDTRFASTPIH